MTEEFDPMELEQYLMSLRAFHEKEDAVHALFVRSFTIELLIRNSGRAPAEGVAVRLEVPEGVEILDGRELRAPAEPALPRFFRSTLDFSGNHAANQFLLRDLAASAALHGTPPPWRWHFARDDRELRLAAGKLVHTDERITPRLRVAFPMVDGKARGFNLAGAVLVSNPPDEVHVELHIIPDASDMGRRREPVDG